MNKGEKRRRGSEEEGRVKTLLLFSILAHAQLVLHFELPFKAFSDLYFTIISLPFHPNEREIKKFELIHEKAERCLWI